MYVLIFLLLIFYDFFEGFVPMANYWDELVTFAVFCWGAYSFRKNPGMSKYEKSNWFFLILLVVIGALGNVFHPGLQTSMVACVKDVIALCKFPAIFLILERGTMSQEKREELIPSLAKISRWILLITLAAVVVGRFVDLGFYTGEVRILPTFEFVFTHPTFFVSAYVMLAAVLIAESLDKNRLFLLLDCFLIFMAQRTKGYIFIVFLVLFVLLGEKWLTKILTAVFGSEKEKIRPGRLLLAMAVVGVLIVVAGWSRIDYFINLGMTTTRGVMHVVGLKILVDFFPLGSGLGTFGSHLSGRYYSNIYDLYEISNTYGMTRQEYKFISDLFWPYIYGQFGVFGTLIYLKLLISIFFRQFRARISDGSRIAAVLVWLYAIIATTSEAYFTNGTGVQMAMFLSIFIGYGCRKEESVQQAVAE